jgi:anti-sigma-K factor RskA
MTCTELLEMAGAHALGALEPGERDAVEAHLASPGPHQGCHEAVARARTTTAALAGVLPEIRPSLGVWSAIEVRVRDREAPRRRRWAVPLGLGAAAAAAVLAFLLVGERLEVGRLREEAAQARSAAATAAAEVERLRGELAAAGAAAELPRQALAVLDAPGTRLVPLTAVPGQSGRATAIVDAAGGRALIATASLPPQPGRVYQLWVIRGSGAPAPAGFLVPLAGGAAAGEVDRSLLRGAPPDALAVSLEPAGGSPAPTQVVLVGRLAG